MPVSHRAPGAGQGNPGNPENPENPRENKGKHGNPAKSIESENIIPGNPREQGTRIQAVQGQFWSHLNTNIIITVKHVAYVAYVACIAGNVSTWFQKKKERSKKARSPSASLVVVGVGGGIENHHITFFAFLRIHSHILVTGGQYSPSNLHDRKPDNV